MKKFCLTLSACLVIAPAFRVAADTENRAYLQASPLYAIPGKNLEAGAGLCLALGASFAGSHESELEGLSVDTEFESNNTSTHSEQSDIKFRHLLATYRYTATLNKTFRVFAGLSAGVARVSYEVATVDSNVTVAGGLSPAPVGGGYGAVLMDTRFAGGSSFPLNLPTYTHTYNPANGTLTSRASGSNTVAAGGPHLGFSYDMTKNSAVGVSAKWLYLAETDVTAAGGIVFIQAGYRYAF